MSETETETTEETPGDGDGAETQPDTETEEEEASETPAEAAARLGSDQVMKKADSENRRYHKALDKILGPDENRHECPACNGLGVTWGEQEALPEVKQAEDAEPCPDCNALGVTKTGSLQPGQETKPCGKCGGRGWRDVVQLYVAPTTIPTVDTAAPQTMQGQWIPGRGFVPYGQEEPIPGSYVGQ